MPRNVSSLFGRRRPLSRGLTPGQMALAWLLHQHPAVVPIPGSRNPAHIDENLASASVSLSDDDIAEIDRARQLFQPAGKALLGA